LAQDPNILSIELTIWCGDGSIPNDDLHFSCPLRPIVLAVVFVKRWIQSVNNSSEICDHEFGLKLSSLRLLQLAKSGRVAARAYQLQSEEKLSEAESTIAELTASRASSQSVSQAAVVQLRSFKKCNTILHRQLKSFRRFHTKMIESQELVEST
jgi:hypothetical protein